MVIHFKKMGGKIVTHFKKMGGKMVRLKAALCNFPISQVHLYQMSN